ncbi:MAG TPA: LssY C-terminal domain-containing protein [Stenomitos sp.]
MAVTLNTAAPSVRRAGAQRAGTMAPADSQQPTARRMAADHVVLTPQRPGYVGTDLDFLPRTVMNAEGDPGDPINLLIKGHKSDIIKAFEKAGWVQADPLNMKSSLKMIWATISRKPYHDAPVSSLFYEGSKHKQDLAFERPSSSTKQRDHLRLWDTGRKDAGGAEIWAVAATEDTGIGRNRRELGITHRINGNVDEERDLVSKTLAEVGVRSQGMWERGATDGVNGGGDKYHTDGGVHVLSVADQSWTNALWKQFGSFIHGGEGN